MRLHSTRLVSLFVAGLLVLGVACGGGSGSSSPTASGGGSGSMAAKIDGAAWTSAVPPQATLSHGVLIVSGNDGARTIAFAIALDAGLATYSIGASLPVNSATLKENPSAVWLAGFGLAGSGAVNLVALSSTTTSGTFSFDLFPVSGTGATGLRSISVGTFDKVPIGGIAADSGDSMTASIDNSAWSASLHMRAAYEAGWLTIFGQDASGEIVSLVLFLSQPGTVPLTFTPVNGSFAGVTVGGQNRSTALPGGQGSVTVTTFSSDRVAGVFSFVTGNAPFSVQGTTTVTNGAFDMALQRF